MDYNGICSLRFASNSILKALHKDEMATLCAKYPKSLGRVFNQYKLKIIKEQKAIPLDYVMVLPNKIMDKIKRNIQWKMLKCSKFLDEFDKKRNDYIRIHKCPMPEHT